MKFKLDDHYSIRLATPLDADNVFALTKSFISESEFSGMEINDDSLKAMVNLFLSSDPKNRTCILLCEDDNIVGYLAGVVGEDHLFIRGKIATEVAWYVDSNHRGSGYAPKLIDAFEEWAKFIQADFISLSSLDNKDLDKLYTKHGYKAVEKSYLKWLR